jgi:hypothetical protein
MSVRQFPAASALAAWSLLVWTTRIRNIWGDDDLTTAEAWGRTALALSFTVLGLAVGYAVVRQAAWLRPTVLGLAAWTIAVWAVRAAGIASGDHDAAFIAVHLVLAIISALLAALAIREVRSAVEVSSG